MLQFSDKLKLLIDESGISIYQLAKSCYIGRATLQQSITGERMPSLAFVEKQGNMHNVKSGNAAVPDNDKDVKPKFKGNLMAITNCLVNEVGINEQEAKELIIGFVTVFPHEINELYKFIEANDHTKAKRLLHKMKGSSGNLRINYLLELLNELEKELPEIKKNSLDLNIDKMNQYIELLKYELE